MMPAGGTRGRQWWETRSSLSVARMRATALLPAAHGDAASFGAWCGTAWFVSTRDAPGGSRALFDVRGALPEQDFLLRLGHRRLRRPVLRAERIGAHGGRTRGDRVEPALQAGKSVDVLLLPLVGHDPRIAR